MRRPLRCTKRLTSSDTIARIDRSLWSEQGFNMSGKRPDMLKIPRKLFERLINLLTYAARRDQGERSCALAGVNCHRRVLLRDAPRRRYGIIMAATVARFSDRLPAAAPRGSRPA